MLQRTQKRIYNLFHPILGELWCLHRVLNTKSLFVENKDLEITPEFLKRRIKQYKAANFEFISIDEVYLNRLSKFRFWWQPKFVNVTFDDGFEDIYSNAFPILREYRIPFTIYLSTDFVEKKVLIWWLILERIIRTNDEIVLSTNTIYTCPDILSKRAAFKQLCDLIYSEKDNPVAVFRRLFSNYIPYFAEKVAGTLNWEQIQEMCDSGLCTLGSHTVTHPVLTKQLGNEVRREIEESKRMIEKKLQQEVLHFSYPYSFWSKEVQEVVSKSGYKTAAMGYGGSCRYMKDDFFKLPRVYLVEELT